MSWRKYTTTFDPDTVRILEIAETFLTKFFGHPASDASTLIESFLEIHGSRYDEDFLHHQSSYRVAALIHYLQAIGGDVSGASEWLVDQGHNNPPREAIDYFREHYFTKP